MSVDLAVAPPLGLLGRLLNSVTGWPPTGEAANLATNRAWANLAANIERKIPSEMRRTVTALFEAHHIAARRVRAFAGEWANVEQTFRDSPLAELVCVVGEGESCEGEVVARRGAARVATFSREELSRFAAETTEFAAILGAKAFTASNLRDAFFYQFDHLPRVVNCALATRRGLLLQ